MHYDRIMTNELTPCSPIEQVFFVIVTIPEKKEPPAFVTYLSCTMATNFFSLRKYNEGSYRSLSARTPTKLKPRMNSV